MCRENGEEGMKNNDGELHVSPFQYDVQVLVCVAVSVPVVTVLLYLSETLRTRIPMHQGLSSQRSSVNTFHRCWRLVIGALFAEGK